MALAKHEASEKTMDMGAMMEMWRKLATPGAPHKRLAERAGRWDTRSKSWMEPGKPPVESTGSAVRKMIMDGRFLQEEYSGEMMGNTFSGIGITGYDNHTKKYVMSWIENMSTGIYLFEGTAGADGRTITLEGGFEHPLKGPVRTRLTYRFVDDHTEIFEMSVVDRNGNEEKSEMTYTRRR